MYSLRSFCCKFVLKSGGCLLHLGDLLCAIASLLTALVDGANLIVDLADGGVDLALLGSLLLLSDLTLLVLLPVLLSGLGGLLLGLGSQEGLALAGSPDVRLSFFLGVVGVRGDVFCSALLSLHGCSLHLKFPLPLSPDTLLFPDLDLFLLALLALKSILSDLLFGDPQFISISGLLLPLDINLPQALLLFLDADIFKALSSFNRRLILSFVFLILLLVDVDSILSFILLFVVFTELSPASLIDFFLEVLFVPDSSDSFFLDPCLLDGLTLCALPLLGLPSDFFFASTLLGVLDLADADLFFM